MTRSRPYRFQTLFAVVLAIVWLPIAQGTTVQVWLFEGLMFLGLIAGVYALSLRRIQAAAAGTLAVIAAVLRIAALTTQTDGLLIAASIASLLFFVIVATVVLGAVLRAERVTTDTIVGGLAVYVLIGLCFALAYFIVEQRSPGSLSLPALNASGVHQEQGPPRIDLFLYFSFVTLSTVGYGDITPANLLMRQLAITEAVMGQLYLAVLVARLVAMNIGHSVKGQKDDSNSNASK